MILKAKLKPNTEDLTGRKFGRLKVIAFAGYKTVSVKNQGRAHWVCVDPEGNQKVVEANHLKRGLITGKQAPTKPRPQSRIPHVKYVSSSQSWFVRLEYRRGDVYRSHTVRAGIKSKGTRVKKEAEITGKEVNRIVEKLGIPLTIKYLRSFSVMYPKMPFRPFD